MAPYTVNTWISPGGAVPRLDQRRVLGPFQETSWKPQVGKPVVLTGFQNVPV